MKVKKIGKEDLIIKPPEIHAIRFPCFHYTLQSQSTQKGEVSRARAKHWKRPADPASAYQLVETYLNFVKVAQPQYWLLENVPGLLPWIKLKPRCKAHLSKTMVRCFWGTFPTFLIPTDLRKRNIMDIQGPLRAWERAKIPMAVSRALGQSILASKGVYEK